MTVRGARPGVVDQTAHGIDRTMHSVVPGWTRSFPGCDIPGQAPDGDQVTEEVVTAQVGLLPVTRFFTRAEEACARALLGHLTGQDEDETEDETGLAGPVLELVDARLESGETDGWRYADMPEDRQAWRDTLAYLDADAGRRCGTSFADAPRADQSALVQAVQDLGCEPWHRLRADHVWSLWTRYACTACYAHPFA